MFTQDAISYEFADDYHASLAAISNKLHCRPAAELRGIYYTNRP
jgi:hypothetical protein